MGLGFRFGIWDFGILDFRLIEVSRFARNDGLTWGRKKGWSSAAASPPLTTRFYYKARCHSERSEESVSF